MESYRGSSHKKLVSSKQLQKILREVRNASMKLALIEEKANQSQAEDVSEADRNLQNFLDNLPEDSNA